MDIFLVLLLSLMSAFLYWLGGEHDTKWRDIGCMVCNMLSLVILDVHAAWWQWLIASGLTFGAYTTYHKWLNRLFGDSKDDVHWYGWAMHGFALGCALLVFYQRWKVLLIRAIFLAPLICLWSLIFDDVRWEAGGRGFWVNLSILAVV